MKPSVERELITLGAPRALAKRVSSRYGRSGGPRIERTNYQPNTFSSRAEVRTSPHENDFAISGCAASYNVRSQLLPPGFREVLKPGCFRDALKSSADVRCLFNHNSSVVLGRSTAGTLQLRDSAKGLMFRVQLDPNQQAHRDVYASVKRGDISECSFGFTCDPDDQTWSDDLDENGMRVAHRYLHRVNLGEVSVCAFPAYNSPGSTSATARTAVPLIESVHPSNIEFARQLQNLDDAYETDLLRIQVEAIGRLIERGF